MTQNSYFVISNCRNKFTIIQVLLSDKIYIYDFYTLTISQQAVEQIPWGRISKSKDIDFVQINDNNYWKIRIICIYLQINCQKYGEMI